jgi:hypothetical protein
MTRKALSPTAVVPGKVQQQRRQAKVVATAVAIRAAVLASAKASGWKPGRGAPAAHLAPAARAASDTPIHGQPHILNDPMFYPEHDERTESPAYKKVHRDLCVTQNLPCMVCGVRNSILAKAEWKNDPEMNPYGAKQMETHHHVIEWALANAIDPVLFAKTLLPHLRSSHQDNAAYQVDAFTAEQISDWVDHSPDNLWVLCDVHHRHKWVGIHEISYPLWVPQALFKTDFVKSVQAAEAAADAKPAPPAKTAASKRSAKKAPARKTSRKPAR